MPTYATLAGLVTEAFRAVEQQLTTQLAGLLTSDLRWELDVLFTTAEATPAHSHRPYRLTTLKRSLELLRPAAIRANTQDYTVLHALFTQVYSVVQALDLSEELVRYHARYVERAQVFPVQQADKKYLMVLCFVVYQFWPVQHHRRPPRQYSANRPGTATARRGHLGVATTSRRVVFRRLRAT